MKREKPLISGSGLRLTAEQIELRKPLWQALSELMLDTDLSEIWARNIAREMTANHFSISEAELIFMREVGPAFAFNFFAWEWEGWQQSFVEQRLIQCLQQHRLQQRCVAILFRPLLRSQWNRILPQIRRELAATEC